MGVHGLMARGVPPQPAFLRIIKIVVIVFALLVLALAAYSLSVFGSYTGYYGDNGAGGLLIFVAIKTFIIFGLALFLEMRAQQYFYRIIMLIAYIISIIFWLSAWAWSASLAALWLSYSGDFDEDCYFDNNDNYVCNPSSNNPWKREGGALAGCAAIGAITWVLLIVHLAFYIMACLRDPAGTGPGSQQAELGNVKANEAQAPYAPQQPYPQQPVAHQQPYGEQPNYGAPPHQQTYPTQ